MALWQFPELTPQTCSLRAKLSKDVCLPPAWAKRFFKWKNPKLWKILFFWPPAPSFEAEAHEMWRRDQPQFCPGQGGVLGLARKSPRDLWLYSTISNWDKGLRFWGGSGVGEWLRYCKDLVQKWRTYCFLFWLDLGVIFPSFSWLNLKRPCPFRCGFVLGSCQIPSVGFLFCR